MYTSVLYHLHFLNCIIALHRIEVETGIMLDSKHNDADFEKPVQVYLYSVYHTRGLYTYYKYVMYICIHAWPLIIAEKGKGFGVPT